MKYDTKSGTITFADVDELAFFVNDIAEPDWNGVVPETDEDIDYTRDGWARASKLDIERALGIKPYPTREEMELKQEQDMRKLGMVPGRIPGSWVNPEAIDAAMEACASSKDKK